MRQHTTQTQDDPFFYTPRQLAAHLLLTYPADYKVSPAQLKHSIIIGNDVSGKVLLCAVSKVNDLEAMLGVETLGARLWLWDEITKMRKTSKGYSEWKWEQDSEDSQADSSSAGVVVGTKRKRGIKEGEEEEKEPAAKRPNLAIVSRWAAVKTAKPQAPDVDQSFQKFIQNPMPETPAPDSSVSTEEIYVIKKRSDDESFLPSMRSSTIGTSTEMLTASESIDWDADFQLGGLLEHDKMMDWGPVYSSVSESGLDTGLDTGLDSSGTPFTSVSETVLDTPFTSVSESVLDAHITPSPRSLTATTRVTETAEDSEFGFSTSVNPALLSRSPFSDLERSLHNAASLTSTSTLDETPRTSEAPSQLSESLSPSGGSSRDPSSDFSPPSSLFRSPTKIQTPKSTQTQTHCPSAQKSVRALRPRSHNIHLPKSKLADILDPETLDKSEILTMLRTIQEIPEQDIYNEFIRAAKVTAGIRGLPPSALVSKTGKKADKETVRYVHEMAAVYVCWILSTPYPLESVDPEEVGRMEDFELFLQFKVQFLNLLIPYDTRRNSGYRLFGKVDEESGEGGESADVRADEEAIAALDDEETAAAPNRRQSRLFQAKAGMVTSDLPFVETDRCPETGFTSKQRKWGEIVVRKYKNYHKAQPSTRQQV